jgi:hypothetical protein
MVKEIFVTHTLIGLLVPYYYDSSSLCVYTMVAKCGETGFTLSGFK